MHLGLSFMMVSKMHTSLYLLRLQPSFLMLPTLASALRTRSLLSASKSVPIFERTSQVSRSMSTTSPVRPEIANLLRSAQAFCFDVDSTVITKEGIDELAAYKGVGQEVADLTAKAMGGTVLFQDALAARLDIIKPSKNDINTFLEKHPLELTAGVEELINTLHEHGKIVYLVSGGFRQMIEPVADKLKIPFHRIFANRLTFNEETGEFAGFDPTEPTSRDGGKPAVVQSLIDAHGYSPIVMVGDGATDLQAKPPAHVFLGFGGIVVREKVRDGADWYLYDFQSLIDVVKGKLGPL